MSGFGAVSYTNEYLHTNLTSLDKLTSPDFCVQFALKSLNLDHDRSSKPKQGDPEAERDLLRSLSHEHVLAYVDSYVVECFLCVVTEYCQGGDIERFLGNSGRPVPEDLLTCWLHQMALGLEVRHNLPSRPLRVGKGRDRGWEGIRDQDLRFGQTVIS